MKKQVLQLLSLSFISTFSVSAVAVEGGSLLSWADHPYLVESQCTGTVIAGKYILLSGHCANSVDSPFPREVNLYNGKSIMPVHREHLYDPNLPESKFADIAIWTLPTTVPIDKVMFIANLNDEASIVNLDDNVSFMGFGQDDNTPRLGQTFNHVTDLGLSKMRISYSDEIGHSVPGDSGAPIFNNDNKIIAINYAGSGSIDPITNMYTQDGVNLRFVKNWLLDNIDSWHSATELKLTGNTTIEIQSLHVKNVDMSTRWNNNTLTTGDVTVTGGTCVTDGAVAPFGICTLELSSSGNAGKVTLENDNNITINRANTPAPDNNSEKGASFGIFSLMALLALTLRRKFS